MQNIVTKESMGLLLACLVLLISTASSEPVIKRRGDRETDISLIYGVSQDIQSVPIQLEGSIPSGPIRNTMFTSSGGCKIIRFEHQSRKWCLNKLIGQPWMTLQIPFAIFFSAGDSDLTPIFPILLSDNRVIMICVRRDGL